jgi:hypothetical protein
MQAVKAFALALLAVSELSVVVGLPAVPVGEPLEGLVVVLDPTWAAVGRPSGEMPEVAWEPAAPPATTTPAAPAAAISRSGAPSRRLGRWEGWVHGGVGMVLLLEGSAVRGWEVLNRDAGYRAGTAAVTPL